MSEKNKRPFFSIVIATYNSEKTLVYTLESIEKQKIEKDEVEVLIVDGGSTDDTINIVKAHGLKVINNPYRLPEYAKAIGIKNATGHYVLRMDSDEEFSYDTQLHDKMIYLKKYPEVKMLLPNRYATGRKEICGICAEYMNILGDPFSYFVYKTKYDKYSTYEKNIIKKDGKFALMKFDQGDIYPLADSATSALSLDYMRENYPNDYTTIEFTCGAYDYIIRDTKFCGCIKGDNIKHNCSSTLKVYFSKLRFRVINNLFHKQESGFSAKLGINKKLKIRKIMFCFYALLIPLPIIDSIRMAVKYRNWTYLLHFVYLYYVCIQIVILGMQKIFGKIAENKSYGK